VYLSHRVMPRVVAELEASFDLAVHDSDWPPAREEILQGYYQQFGLIRLPGGSSAIRWNEGTWRGVRETLDVVFDPAFAPSADTSGSPTA